MKPKVSFDFDNTLSRPVVQKYAAELISRGIDVMIITSRRRSVFRDHGLQVMTDNSDLHEIADSLGIRPENRIFTEGEDKISFIKDADVIFHLDDDPYELALIHEARGLRTKGISVWNTMSWKKKCEKVLAGSIK